MKNKTTSRNNPKYDYRFSIIIPIHNEALILDESIGNLLLLLDTDIYKGKYELLLCENGSTDETLSIAKKIENSNSAVRVEILPNPSYGLALRHGISVAQGEITVIFNADYWDFSFLTEAIILLKDYDIVVGSKNAPGAKDHRPIYRRLITILFNRLLRFLFLYEGTDTHGIKVTYSDIAKALVKQCKTGREIFDTEFIIRAWKQKYSICEIPVTVKEIRPSRSSIWRRIPRTILDLFTLLLYSGKKRIRK